MKRTPRRPFERVFSTLRFSWKTQYREWGLERNSTPRSTRGYRLRENRSFSLPCVSPGKHSIANGDSKERAHRDLRGDIDYKRIVCKYVVLEFSLPRVSPGKHSIANGDSEERARRDLRGDIDFERIGRIALSVKELWDEEGIRRKGAAVAPFRYFLDIQTAGRRKDRTGSTRRRILQVSALSTVDGPRGQTETEVMINRSRRGHSYSDARGEILGPSEDDPLRKHLPRMFPLTKNESQRLKED
ncbi:hypothetical protein TNIN_153291 [Trichonephila inaurata madagascariensis]|uniref:Uncharacterized protein n=1 Tax=Trichonephila inaurata madagascariensis TaxID=2747483 RepID=A0A8X6XT63_9ARAC|nr:hypothetical protein TNIN_153291 [Trichonephila inaurata madagascariensis]